MSSTIDSNTKQAICLNICNLHLVQLTVTDLHRGAKGGSESLEHMHAVRVVSHCACMGMHVMVIGLLHHCVVS